MADNLTKQQRSYTMSRIKSRDTNPELILRKELWNINLKAYRLKNKLIGKPDIIFARKKIAIFIDGCFWHMCPDHFKKPKSNLSYWTPKFNKNKKRAKEVNKKLEEDGWKVLRFWEHEINNNIESCVKDISVEYNKSK